MVPLPASACLSRPYFPPHEAKRVGGVKRILHSIRRGARHGRLRPYRLYGWVSDS